MTASRQSPPRRNEPIRVVRSLAAASFAQIPNDLIRDQRLSRFARSVLIEILSNSDEFNDSCPPSADSMWRRSGGERRGEGREVYRRAFREMEETGYMARSRHQARDGTWYTRLHFTDTPGCDAPAAEPQGGQPPLRRVS